VEYQLLESWFIEAVVTVAQAEALLETDFVSLEHTSTKVPLLLSLSSPCRCSLVPCGGGSHQVSL